MRFEGKLKEKDEIWFYGWFGLFAIASKFEYFGKENLDWFLGSLGQEKGRGLDGNESWEIRGRINGLEIAHYKFRWI